MPAATIRTDALHRFSRQEFDQLVEMGAFEGHRVELLHGMLVQMSPHSPPHDGLLQRLTKVVMRAVGDAADVRVQMSFALSDTSEPEPDLAVVPLGDELVRHPDTAWLLVEVAVSSLDDDRDIKGPAYAAAEVPEYWLVDVEGERIVRYTEAGPGGYARNDVIDLAKPVPVGALPGVTVDLRDLFAR